jgi:hypothetical protein
MDVFSMFVESLKRLYQDGKISEKKILEFNENEKITNDEKEYILDAH